MLKAKASASTRDLVVAGASLASTVVTVIANVPLNRRLERTGESYWPAYRRRWTAWNSLRGVMATVAVAAATVA